MPETTNSAFKSSLQLAIEESDPEIIAGLSKSETVFFICQQLGVEPPESHPDKHAGNVQRDTLRAWAFAAADVDEPEGGDEADDEGDDEGDDE